MQLRRRLAEGGNGGPWGLALQAELKTEVADERRTFWLKSELCTAMRRRHQVLEAVQARHAGLERLAGCALHEACRPENLDRALSDGAAEAKASVQASKAVVARRGAPAGGGGTQPPAQMTADTAFEAEQHLVTLAAMLDKLTAGQSKSAAEASGANPLYPRVLSRLEAYSDILLECGAQLPPGVPQRAAVARKQLRRQLSAMSATRSEGMAEEVGPAVPAADSTAAASPAPKAVWHSTGKWLGRPGRSDRPAGVGPSSVCSVSLPEELLGAWRLALDAAAAEREAQPSVELAVLEMIEVAATWALQLQAARAPQQRMSASEAG